MKKRPIHKAPAHPVAKTAGTTAKHKHKTTKTKTVKIKHHHRKPYRKRHISGLAIFVIMGLFLMAFIWQYNVNLSRSLQDAHDYISNLYDDTSDENYNSDLILDSTYGFSISYDQKSFYATALDGATGKIYLGPELDTKRAYNLVRISPQWSANGDNNPSLSLQYHDEMGGDFTSANLAELEQQLIANQKPDGFDYEQKQLSSENVKLDGVAFIKSNWERQLSSEIGSQLTPTLVTYTGVVNGKPMMITVNRGISGGSNIDLMFMPAIDSIKFGERTQANVQSDSIMVEQQRRAVSLFNALTLTGIASAAERPEPSASEKNSAIYGPSVVKIYNVYCMDIVFDGLPFIDDVCDGGAGSGFFISQDGHIASNGHVATSSPKDLAIQYAFAFLYFGNDSYFSALAEKAGLTQADLAVTKDRDEKGQIALDKLYAIPDSAFSKTNDVTNLLVSLNEKMPDVKELVDLTKSRKSYPEQDSIKQAKLISADYRLLDGATAFRASDVAIIKIDGNSYPTAKLGTIDSVSQGSGLSIFGFPGIAGDNGISESKESKVTLTSGKVSSVKNAKGSDKKLIETDTTIGHGNSGGPALNDYGEVVGIATYTVDGSGGGDGVYNYIRDIKDLKDLASSSSVSVADSAAGTQLEWEKGLGLFYRARYSGSVKSFEKVKSAYPQHPTVASFITTAQERIKNGEDVKDFPIVIVAVAAVVVIAGIGVTAFIIIRHKKTHNVYKANVSTGGMQPLQPGASPVHVSYDPAQVAAANNPIIAAQQMANPANPTIQPVQPVQPVMPVNPVPVQPEMAQPQNVPVQVVTSQQPIQPVSPQDVTGNPQQAGTVITPQNDQKQ